MTAAALPRLGVVLPEFGIPSQVWAVRQALAFARVEPVLFAWKVAEGAAPMPPALEAHLFRRPYPPPETRLRRFGWKLGLSAAMLPDRAGLADIRQTLLGARLSGVLCHFAAMAIPVTAALDGALPVAAQVHGRDVSSFLANPAYVAALRRTLPRLAHLAAVGRFQIETLRPLGLGPAHSVIPCGAPLAQFSARPLPERAPDAPIRFVSVGRISPEKGVMETLAAFAALDDPQAELVCIGDGPEFPRLREAARPFGARVRLPGALPPAEVARELAAAHVCVHHARPAGGWLEGFGVSLTEAGASGLPLVASRLGGIPDQVEEGGNGFLFSPGDVAAQTAAMARLAADEPLRRRMGARAREIAGRFDAGLMAGRLEDALLEAFGRVSSATRRSHV